MDVIDEGSGYQVVLDVPGVKSDQVEVTPGPAQGTILIRATVPATETKGTFLRGERNPGSGPLCYSRIVPVAWDADTEQAKARVSDGVLTVSVPKTQPSAKGSEKAKKTS